MDRVILLNTKTVKFLDGAFGRRQVSTIGAAPGHGGRCLPIGRHCYLGKLYALDAARPDLKRPDKAALQKAIHIWASCTLSVTQQG